MDITNRFGCYFATLRPDLGSAILSAKRHRGKTGKSAIESQKQTIELSHHPGYNPSVDFFIGIVIETYEICFHGDIIM